MDKKWRKNSLLYKQREYSQTHLNSQEVVSTEYKKKINKNYYNREQLRMVDDVLYTINSYTAKLLKDQVYYIVQRYRLKDLCSRCKLEVIVACIVIFVWRGFNNKLVIDRNSIWEKYELTWKIYGKVMDNLLRKTREDM